MVTGKAGNYPKWVAKNLPLIAQIYSIKKL